MACSRSRVAVGLTLAISLMLTAIEARAQDDHQPIDDGGNLQAYLDDVERLNALRSVKRIAGRCASACTAYLGVRRVCVEPGAEVWFHAAYRPETGTPDPAGSLRLLSMYPPAVRRWAIRVRALEQTEWGVERMLTGVELIRFGVARCPPTAEAPNSATSRSSRR